MLIFFAFPFLSPNFCGFFQQSNKITADTHLVYVIPQCNNQQDCNKFTIKCEESFETRVNTTYCYPEKFYVGDVN